MSLAAPLTAKQITLVGKAISLLPKEEKIRIAQIPLSTGEIVSKGILPPIAIQPLIQAGFKPSELVKPLKEAVERIEAPIPFPELKPLPPQPIDGFVAAFGAISLGVAGAKSSRRRRR